MLNKFIRECLWYGIASLVKPPAGSSLPEFHPILQISLFVNACRMDAASVSRLLSMVPDDFAIQLITDFQPVHASIHICPLIASNWISLAT